MKRISRLTHRFVEYMPETLEEGVLYVSMQNEIVMHKCCCGCGNEVVTPLSPTDWRLTFDGISITLDPSIGNWGFECRSHYWIRANSVRWSKQWSNDEVEAGRLADRRAKREFFQSQSMNTDGNESEIRGNLNMPTPTEGRLRRLWKRLRR